MRTLEPPLEYKPPVEILLTTDSPILHAQIPIKVLNNKGERMRKQVEEVKERLGNSR